MTYVGIDLHTNNMVNVALNDNGEVVREAKLPTATRVLSEMKLMGFDIIADRT